MDLSLFAQHGVTVTPNARLSEYTTFQLGGKCRALIECHNAKEVTDSILTLRSQKHPFLLMGFGSNILASDKGVDLFMIRYTSSTPLIKNIDSATQNIAEIEVDAATQLDDLVIHAIENGLNGLTVFSGIPGTLGGAITGNAGAYGQQISDLLKTITLLRSDNSIITVDRSAIRFEYRDSELKHTDNIVLSATLQLPKTGNINEMRAQRAATIATREQKHGRWQKTPCAGSFFQNVEPTSKAGPRQSAGWFLEQAGCKDMNVHGAHPYPRHANIVTRDNGASAQDVYDLTVMMASAVKEKFGLELSREVRMLGAFDNAPTCNLIGYW